jgi:hypothetical protein
MGVSNAVLYALHGNWAYTATLTRGVQQAMGAAVRPAPIVWLLFLFLIAGVAFSAWQRRSFHLRWRPTMDWIRHPVGGTLMGFGAAMVPGGNDVLLLHGIPTLSPHAVPAYLAMLLGIGATLGVMRMGGAGFGSIDCRGDICSR